jgi:hypothetical protein
MDGRNVIIADIALIRTRSYGSGSCPQGAVEQDIELDADHVCVGSGNGPRVILQHSQTPV